MSWWNPKSWFSQRGVKAANRAIAARRKHAWGKFEAARARELNWAMQSLAGYGGAPSLSDLAMSTSGVASGRLPTRRNVNASYDAAGTTDDNRRHWTAADALGANAANSPYVRRILRNRSRYEVANNSYARGIMLTLANDVVGTGPRLQISTGNPDVDSFLEGRFLAWSKAARLAAKLRTACMAKATDGEAFLLFTTNPLLPGEVKMDLRLVEAERVTTPTLGLEDARHVDGITFDADGNPIQYYILPGHPGEPGQASQAVVPKPVDAADIVHWFRADRAGQVRGIPEITSALPLFAQLRRYTMAVLDAAEAAADFAILIYTEMPPDGEAQVTQPMSTWEMERRMMTVMPAGYKAAQMKAEQPSTTYAMFKAELINEMARCLNMPYNVAACNSSSYNFASGRLDHLVYCKSVAIEQANIEAELLERLLAAWLAEALRAYSLERPDVAILSPSQVTATWVWDGYGSVNPVDESNARETDLGCNMVSYPTAYARAGMDWETEWRSDAKAINVTFEEYQRRMAEKRFAVKGAVARPASDGAAQDQANQANDAQRRADRNAPAAPRRPAQAA